MIPRKPERAERGSDHVDLRPRVDLARLGDDAHGQHDGRDHQRQVDREDPAPGGGVHELAADERPQHRPDPPHAVQAPTARPRSSGGKTATITASAAGVEQSPGDALEGTADDQHLDRGRDRAQQRGGAEPGDPQREHSPLPEHVAQRAADQQEGAERDEVGVGGPLLAGQPAAEVFLDRR